MNQMSQCIFSETIPIKTLYQFLETIHVSCDNTHYIVDENTYKKMIFMQWHIPFLQALKPYYLPSKQHYITRELTYKSFTNLLRQICRSNNHPFYTKIHYNHSKHQTLYFIQKQSGCDGQKDNWTGELDW